MNNKILIHIIAKPAVGKYTIAKALQKEIDAFLVDNHLVNDLFFSVTDTSNCLPPQVFTFLNKGYELLFEYIKTLKMEKPLIFTNVLTTLSTELEFAQKIEKLAKDIGYKYLPVKLLLNEEEIIKRVCSEDRKAKKKLTDPELYKKFFGNIQLITDIKDIKEIDINNHTVQDTVAAIKQYLV